MYTKVAAIPTTIALPIPTPSPPPPPPPPSESTTCNKWVCVNINLNTHEVNSTSYYRITKCVINYKLHYIEFLLLCSGLAQYSEEMEQQL